MRNVTGDNLIYVKEDLIIPQVREWPHECLPRPPLRGLELLLSLRVPFSCACMQGYSFYDLIATQARGKSGPLFSFDVHDDVRMVSAGLDPD